jgi:membrane-bound ClpP family serine protease
VQPWPKDLEPKREEKLMSGMGACLLWPFTAIWRLVAFIFELTGRLVAIVLGLALMILGVLISLTVVGATVGVPMIIVGLLLIVRGFF